MGVGVNLSYIGDCLINFLSDIHHCYMHDTLENSANFIEKGKKMVNGKISYMGFVNAIMSHLSLHLSYICASRLYSDLNTCKLHHIDNI